jgi:hypothetical protein
MPDIMLSIIPGILTSWQERLRACRSFGIRVSDGHRPDRGTPRSMTQIINRMEEAGWVTLPSPPYSPSARSSSPSLRP